MVQPLQKTKYWENLNSNYCYSRTQIVQGSTMQFLHFPKWPELLSTAHCIDCFINFPCNLRSEPDIIMTTFHDTSQTKLQLFLLFLLFPLTLLKYNRFFLYWNDIIDNNEVCTCCVTRGSQSRLSRCSLWCCCKLWGLVRDCWQDCLKNLPIMMNWQVIDF